MNYIDKIKAAIASGSLNTVVELLKEIDNAILTGDIPNFDLEFAYYFKMMLNMTNPDCKVDGELITLGNLLIDEKLKFHDKLTPTLMLYFYFDKKNKIGLDDLGNEVDFSSDGDMSIITDEDVRIMLGINKLNLGKLNCSIEEYNYKVMHNLLHEITHVHQCSRREDTTDLLEKVEYYDYQLMNIVIKRFLGGSGYNNPYIHNTLMSEYAADEQATIYMHWFMNKHPEYFSLEFLTAKRNSLINTKKTLMGIKYRDYFADGLRIIRDVFIRKGKLEDVSPYFSQIEEYQKKIDILLTELKRQGISEDIGDEYFNIFLNDYYKFDGENIVYRSDINKSY